VLAAAEEGTLPVTLSQTLTVGPRTRLEFRRLDDGSYVDVELPRDEYAALRARLDLRAGSHVHLKPLRVTRFAEAG
jgi:sulfate transport system ATP-binding protein